MLNEILRQSYEQGKDIDIYLPKNASEAYIVSAIALQKAMKYVGSETEVSIISSKSYNGIDGLYEGNVETEAKGNNIAIILGAKEKKELGADVSKGSQRDNIYAFVNNLRDQKKKGVSEKLDIPGTNVFIDSNSMSISETMAMQLKRVNALDEEIATLLIYGILKETDNLKNGSSRTFEIVSMLMQNGGNYEFAFEKANNKYTIEQRKAISDTLSTVDIADLDVSGENRRIAFLQIYKSTRERLSALGITDIESVAKKMQEIDDVDMSFVIVQDESNEKKYRIYFMKNDLSKGVDLEALSSKFGSQRFGKFFAESEYSARGVFKGMSQVSKRILEEIEDEYKRESGKVELSYPEEYVPRFREILRKTSNFTKDVSATDLREVSSMMAEGLDLSLLYANGIPLNIFLVREELAKRLDEGAAKSRVALIEVPKEDTPVLEARYGVSDEDMLRCVDLFRDTDASEFRIELDAENGKKIKAKVSRQVERAKKLINSAINAGRRSTKEDIFGRRDVVLQMVKSMQERDVKVARGG